MPRQAGSCRLSQTLGITVSVAMLVQAEPSLVAALPEASRPAAALAFEAYVVAPGSTLVASSGKRNLTAVGRAADRAAVLQQTRTLRSVSPVGAAEYGSSFSAFAGRLSVMEPRSRARVSGCRVACLRAMPNPSIEGTNNGGSSLSAFAHAQPPLFAPHVKRWASQ